MKKTIIKIVLLLLTLSISLNCVSIPIFAENAEKINQSATEPNETIPSDAPIVNCKSAVLIEESTGKILYSKNANEALPPASVTKIMTLLLIMEAVDSGRIGLEDTVIVSANAASMGGSQVFLKEGEHMKLEEMLKSIVIASANDAAVALAEYICGSVEAFVEKMNIRAKELGMDNTTFENVTGLDDTAQNHLTSAYDIALMSQALIAHPTILKYSSVWMDTIRDGAFGLTNTNRLVRFYNGCTGLKTGSTSKAGFCVSATAKRGNLSLICVIMGAETRDERNAQATALLDWGFAKFAMFSTPEEDVGEISVNRGYSTQCKLKSSSFHCVLEKEKIASVKKQIVLPSNISAPVKSGETVGKVIFTCDGEVIGESKIKAAENISQLDFFELLKRIFLKMMLV